MVVLLIVGYVQPHLVVVINRCYDGHAQVDVVVIIGHVWSKLVVFIWRYCNGHALRDVRRQLVVWRCCNGYDLKDVITSVYEAQGPQC